MRDACLRFSMLFGMMLLITPAFMVDSTFASVSPVFEDRFEDQLEWTIQNRRLRGDVRIENGRLIIEALPGGEANWGVSAHRVLANIELGSNLYLIFENVRTQHGGFQVKLVNRQTRAQQSVVDLNNLEGAQTIVVNLKERLEWSGKADLDVGLYAVGERAQVSLDAVYLTTQAPADASSPEALARQVDVRRQTMGLDAVESRISVQKPDAAMRQSERVIYQDRKTNRPVWRITDHPATERTPYYDISAWNADGSRLLLISQRYPNQYLMLNGDGSHPRPVHIHHPRGEEVVGMSLFWHPQQPNLLVTSVTDADATELFLVNADTGETDTIAIWDQGPFQLRPPHPDGQRFLLYSGGRGELAVYDARNDEWDCFEIGESHRQRFTKSDDGLIFFNRNFDPANPDVPTRSDWVIRFDGTDEQKLPGRGRGTHPDWAPDGTHMAAVRGGVIYLWTPDGSEPTVLYENRSSMHGGFAPTTGRWHVSDRDAELGEMIYVIEVETGEVTPLAYHDASYLPRRRPHSDVESTHPGPQFSPDETKVMFNSDAAGPADVYIVVWQQPSPPRAVRREGSRLTWQPGELHREIARYRIYQSTDAGWEEAGVVEQPPFDLSGFNGRRFAIAAEEYSGLMSPLIEVETGELIESTTFAEPADVASVQAVKQGPGWVELQWNAVGSPAGVSHYQVYALPTQQSLCDRSTIVGTTREPKFVDWGRASGEQRYYQVIAVDRFGNASSPTDALAVTFAEGADTNTATWFVSTSEMQISAPMRMGINDEGVASAFSPVRGRLGGTKGHVSMAFNVETAGVYTLWASVYGKDGSSDSFFIRDAEGRRGVWNFGRPPAGYVGPIVLPVPGWINVPLEAGEHMVVFEARESNAHLRWAALTSQPELAGFSEDATAVIQRQYAGTIDKDK